ncbi:MAG: hypothetical protein ACM3MK_03990 [Chitinophagales bacterium]
MKVGITGHQDLIDDDHQTWVKVSLKETIEKLRPEMGLTCLAKGADQIFANLILVYRIQLLSIIPCENYDTTFDEHHLTQYLDLLKKSNIVYKMPFQFPSQEAFYEAGKELVNRVDILIAVWNGMKSQGLGGTADIVHYAIEKDKRIIHLNLLNKTVIQIN